MPAPLSPAHPSIEGFDPVPLQCPRTSDSIRGAARYVPTERNDDQGNQIQERPDLDPRGLAGSHTDRLVRDLLALEHLEAERPTAAERLRAKLGADLVAVLLADLKRLDSGDGFPLRRPPRRVA
jgi:hypothetical protein